MALPVTIFRNIIRYAVLFAGFAALLAIPANAQSTSNPCPAVGADAGCGIILTVIDIGTGGNPCPLGQCVSVNNTGQPAYDDIEDTLIGVVNNSQVPISSMTLTSPAGFPAFAFDGDGICGISPNTGLPYNPRPPCTWAAPTTYEGPVLDNKGNIIGVVSFSNYASLTTGTVNFTPPIPAANPTTGVQGGMAYFSLEESLASATACTSLINNAVAHSLDKSYVDSSGHTYYTRINATFKSNTNLSNTLAQAATLCGFTGWDWQQTVTSLPLPSPFYDAADVAKKHPLHAPPSFNDPPPDDYLGSNPPSPAPLPLYYNPSSGPSDQFSLVNHEPDSNTVTFKDTPGDNCLYGGSGASCGGITAPNLPAGKYVGFTTHLVGLIGAGPGYGIQDTGVGFSWTDSFNGTSGGISVTRNENSIDPGSGTGGVTITAVSNTTSYQYPKGVGVTGINGIAITSSSGTPPTILGNQITVTSTGLAYSRVTQMFNATVTITNVSSTTIVGPLQIVLDSLTSGVTLTNGSGTFGGWTYITVPAVGSLAPGQSVSVSVVFKNPANATINFSPVVYSGSFS